MRCWERVGLYAHACLEHTELLSHIHDLPLHFSLHLHVSLLLFALPCDPSPAFRRRRLPGGRHDPIHVLNHWGSIARRLRRWRDVYCP